MSYKNAYLIIAIILIFMEIGLYYKAHNLIMLIPFGLGAVVFFIMFISEFRNTVRSCPDQAVIKEELTRLRSELLLSNNDLEKAALNDMITMREKCLKRA